MKAKEVRCKKCGGLPELHGQDHLDMEGPFFVVCAICGEDSAAWAYQREAWAQWKYDNQALDTRRTNGGRK